MRVLFVNCVDFMEAALPEGIAILSSILKGQGHEVRLFDTAFLRPKKTANEFEESPNRLMFYRKTPYTLRDLTANEPEVDIAYELSKVVEKFNPSLIAVSAMTTNYRPSMDLIKKVKPGSKVIVGGVHSTLMPEEVIKDGYVDFACIGEGDEALPELCDYIERDRDISNIKNIFTKENKGEVEYIRRNSLGPFVDLNSLPVPDISLFDERHLFRPFLGNIYKGLFMSTARGCPRGCAYCVNSKLRAIFKECGQRYIRFQSPQIVARNIKALKEEHGIEWFKFSDDTFLSRSIKDMYELKSLVKPLGIKFGCSVDPATVTEEKVGLAKEMGCVSMTIGIETGDEEVRRRVLCRHISNQQIERAVRIIRDFDIKLSAFNMIGLPGETSENVYKTIRFNKELEIPDANVYILYPYPGTKIYEESKISLDDYKSIPKMDEAYIFNLSKMTKGDLLFFLNTFNLFLVLPESYWERIEEARNCKKLYRELVDTAQDMIDRNVTYATA